MLPGPRGVFSRDLPPQSVQSSPLQVSWLPMHSEPENAIDPISVGFSVVIHRRQALCLQEVPGAEAWIRAAGQRRKSQAVLGPEERVASAL